MKPRIWRRRILVDRFQWRLLLVMLTHAALIILTLAAAIFLPLYLRLESDHLSQAEQYRAASQFLVLDAWLWPPLLLVFGMMCFHALLVTHRVAGPLVRFRRVLAAVGAGDLTVDAGVRRNDYLQAEARMLAGMIEGLRGRVADVRRQQAACEAAWRECRQAVEACGGPGLSAPLQAFEARLRQAGDALNQFTV